MQNNNYQVINADCLDALREMVKNGIQVDSIVTDPPYEIGFMGKEFDKTGIAHNMEMWRLCLGVLKPGGHLLAFAGARTYHRMVCAIEDAGFEIRDQIMWVYGQGFPKSLNISKALDKMAGAEREKIKTGDTKPDIKSNNYSNSTGKERLPVYITKPATDLAKQWDGWGSALKPAHEPIVMARKPLAEKNIALNVIKHNVGGINIDGCRVELSTYDKEEYIPNRVGYKDGIDHKQTANTQNRNPNAYDIPMTGQIFNTTGRFPANLIHDGSEEVEAEFAKYGEKAPSFREGDRAVYNLDSQFTYVGFQRDQKSQKGAGYTDRGTASRFFYSAKASKKDRLDSKHPTVKPINLMKYLCRLVTPLNGLILDPFAGTGTTGQAAFEEGFRSILIEKDPEYYQDILNRLNQFEEEVA